MKFVYSVTALLISWSAHAALVDWEIFDYKNGDSYLRLVQAPEIKIRLMRDPSGAKLISSKPDPRFNQIELVEYDAGEHGTRQLVRIFHTAIYDKRNRKFLGEFPSRYEVGDSTKGIDQPKWTEDDHSIKIYIPDVGETRVVNLP